MKSAEERTVPLEFEERGIRFVVCKCGLNVSLGVIATNGNACPVCKREHEVSEAARRETSPVDRAEIDKLVAAALAQARPGIERPRTMADDFAAAIEDRDFKPEKIVEQLALPVPAIPAPSRVFIPGGVVEAREGQPACAACGARLTETSLGIFYPCGHELARDHSSMTTRAEAMARMAAKKTDASEVGAKLPDWADPKKPDPLTGRPGNGGKIPDAVDLSAKVSKVADQGPHASSVGHAVAAAIAAKPEAVKETSAKLEKELRAAKDEVAKKQAREAIEKPIFENAMGQEPTARRKQFERIVETVYALDIEAEAKALEKFALPNEELGDRGTHRQRVNVAEEKASRAFKLYLAAKGEYERIEAELEPTIEAMRDEARNQLQAEKDAKARSKAITNGDVDGRAAKLYADEWYDSRLRISRSKGTVEYFERLAQLWWTRCHGERTMLESTR